jgi:N-methylhydantoinase B
METGMNIMKAVTTALAEAQAASEDPFLRDHAMAAFHDAWVGGVFYAPDESGQLVVFLDMNGGGAGGGAQTCNDGMDCSATMTQLMNGLPDIEVNELQTPILYLWRKLNVDSGGPGRYRGGNGLRFAWTPWHTEGGQEHVFSACWHVPPAGVFGGFPGSASAFELATGARVDTMFADGKMPSDVADIGRAPIMLSSKQTGLDLVRGDVFLQREGGGAGLGDPLERDPQVVARDVQDGYITAKAAEIAYGVVLAGGDVDAAATEAQRDGIRAERRSWPRSRDGELARLDEAVGLAPVQPGVGVGVVDGAEVVVCERCRTILGDAGEGYRAHSAMREINASQRLAEYGGYCEPPLEGTQVDLHEHACPGCGALLSVDVSVQPASEPAAA